VTSCWALISGQPNDLGRIGLRGSTYPCKLPGLREACGVCIFQWLERASGISRRDELRLKVGSHLLFVVLRLVQHSQNFVSLRLSFLSVQTHIPFQLCLISMKIYLDLVNKGNTTTAMVTSRTCHSLGELTLTIHHSYTPVLQEQRERRSSHVERNLVRRRIKSVCSG